MEARNTPVAQVVAQFSAQDLCEAYEDIVNSRRDGLLPENSALTKIDRAVAAAIENDDCHLRETEDAILMEMARRFYNANSPEEYTTLNLGDPIFYLDDETGEVESGTIFSIDWTAGKVETICVDFPDDFDEFKGAALGRWLFRSPEAAKAAYRNLRKEHTSES